MIFQDIPKCRLTTVKHECKIYVKLTFHVRITLAPALNMLKRLGRKIKDMEH
jgi:hypothetical protein